MADQTSGCLVCFCDKIKFRGLNETLLNAVAIAIARSLQAETLIRLVGLKDKLGTSENL
jgi:hypothetical protein